VGYLEGKEAVLRLLRERYATAGKKPDVTDEPLDPDKYKNDFYLFLEWGDVAYPSRYEDDCVEWYRRGLDLKLMFRGAATKELKERAERAAFDLVLCLRELYREDLRCEVDGVKFYFYMTGTPNLTSAMVSCNFDIPEEYEGEEGEEGNEDESV
jgi:hypothetical protein